MPLGEFVVHWLLPAHWHLVPGLTKSAEFLPTESVCWPIQQIQSVCDLLPFSSRYSTPAAAQKDNQQQRLPPSAEGGGHVLTCYHKVLRKMPTNNTLSADAGVLLLSSVAVIKDRDPGNL